MKFLFKLFVSVLFVIIVNGETEEEKLRRELLQYYNPTALPPGPVETIMGFNLLTFDMNENLNSIDANLWITLQWSDKRLQWDKDETGIDVLHFKPHEIWRPDITLYNNAQPLEMESYGKSHLLVYPKGNVLWVPPSHAKAYCSMDMTYWPKDIHNCVLQYGSWTHSSKRIHLVNRENATLEQENTTGIRSSEWKLVSSNITRKADFYDCCPDEEFASILLSLKVQRDTPAYHWTVQCPTVVELLSKQLGIATGSLALNAIIYRMTKAPHAKAFPGSMKYALTAIAPFFCLGGYSNMVDNAGYSEADEMELNASKEFLVKTSFSKSNRASWILFAAFLDRICFIIFLIIFFCLLAQYSGVL